MSTSKGGRFATKADMQVVQADVKTLKDDMRTVKADVQILKADVKTLKVDVQILKADVQTLKTDVKTLKVDVQTLKADVQTLTIEVQEVKTNLSAVEKRLDQKIDKIATELVRTQTDVREIKETMATKEDVSRILVAIDRFAGKAEVYDREAVLHGHILTNHEKRLKALESSLR